MRWLAFVLAPILALSLFAGCAPPNRHQDVASTIAVGDPGIPLLSISWRRALADNGSNPRPQEFASPAVVVASSPSEDILFVGAHNGWFSALRAKTSELIWKRKIGSVSSRPLVFRGHLYIGTDDGLVICLDMDGKERWRYATKSPILQTPVTVGDAVLISNEGDQVYSLDLETGKFRWLYKTDADEEFTLRGHAALTVDGDTVYAGFANGSVVALRSATGSVAWLTSLRAGEDRFVDVDTTPVVAGDSLFAASSAGGLFSLDKATGRIRWRRDIRAGGGIAVEDNRLYFVAADLGVFAMDLEGNTVWRQGTKGGGEPSQPVVVDDYLVFALAGAGLFVADKRTGEIVQYFDPGYGISGQPALGRRHLYTLSNSAVLYALAIW